jgi:TnpA family transposase
MYRSELYAGFEHTSVGNHIGCVAGHEKCLDVSGKRGRISSRDIQEQRNSCSCLTLILACIVFWQAKEINRVVLECDPDGNGIDL